MKYIKFFEDIRIQDINLVGGKNASLGEMINNLTAINIRVPTGFAITADAYWYYLQANNFIEHIQSLLNKISDVDNIAILQRNGAEIRKLIMSGIIPQDLEQKIINAYHELVQRHGARSVAVRSSATAEDLPNASFAGQQDTFLHISGEKQLLHACKKSFASLFNDRAIVYRANQGFDHFKVALSIGVQKMVHSDSAVSGVAFSLDTESGFKDVVTIEASYGLGESIVQGLVIPDQYMVHKKMLAQGYEPILKKVCGEKKTKMVYARTEKKIKTMRVPRIQQHSFALTNKEILELTQYVVAIETYYSDIKKQYCPMDIEWAKDSDDGKIYIVQARPETIHAGLQHASLQQYILKDSTEKKMPLVSGLSIGQKIATGIARVVKSVHDIATIKTGDIIITSMTDPDWVPVMKRAAGIITDRGGRTCHAAIVSRELGIAAIVGTQDGTKKIKDGQMITIDCSRGAIGAVYQGKIKYKVNEIPIAAIPASPVSVLINCADPDSAFQASFLPIDGVGLARLEFIITNLIKVHPMACVYPERVTDKKTKEKIKKLTASYENARDFFIEELASGIAMIAGAFYPRMVIVRLSDFKSNEYRNLIGGSYFEPIEENPMIGFRGASRYYHENYKDAFALECAAFVRARRIMGFNNIKIMVPFVRTMKEAEKVIQEMAQHDLVRGQDGLELVMMCEIPSNVLLIEEFSHYFDGFSIGSNDLTQLVLGIDRDSPLIASLFDERNEAVKTMMKMAIEGAHKQGKYIGICGQAPSDYPEISDFLIKAGIDSLSLNVDAVIAFLMKLRN